MLPSLPYFPDKNKKKAIDLTARLKNELEEIISPFSKLDLISAIGLSSVIKHYLKLPIQSLITEQPAIQLLAELCLKYDSYEGKVPKISDIEKILGKLDHYFESLKDSIHHDLICDSLSEEMLIINARLQANIREVNKEKYQNQNKEVIEQIYCNLDDLFLEKFGFSVTDAYNICKFVMARFWTHANYQNYKIASEAKELLSNPVTVNKLFLKNEHLEFYGFYVNNLIDEFSLLTNLLRIDIEELSTIIPRERIEKYLEYFACKFGDRRHENEPIIYEFAISLKPIIRLNDEQIFIPIPELLFWNLPSIIESILKNNPEIHKKLKEIKKDFLENKTAAYLAKLFPTNQIKKNLFYHDQGGRPEIDLLVLFDDKILIIEAKGGHLTQPFFEGKAYRIKSQIKELVVEAYQQGMRAQKYIQNTNKAIFENKKGEKILEIDPNQFKEIFIITVTLEPLNRFATILSSLKTMGFFKEKHFPWSVYIYDLDIITQIVNSPSIFIHYLQQRIAAQIEEIFLYPEELQLFSWYSKKLSLKFKTYGKNFLVLLGVDFYRMFDDYFFNGDGHKPELNLDERTKRLIEKLDRKHQSGYTKTVDKLLNERAKAIH